MAYQSNAAAKSTGYSGNKNRVQTPAPVSSGTTAAKAETLFKTGLWKKEGGKSLASVQVKETITIPAGSYINLFENDKKSDSHPDFSITVREGVLKTK
jgi:uncharacterized cupin superfamily protein